jgi:hypothetical protein
MTIVLDVGQKVLPIKVLLAVDSVVLEEPLDLGLADRETENPIAFLNACSPIAPPWPWPSRLYPFAEAVQEE